MPGVDYHVDCSYSPSVIVPRFLGISHHEGERGEVNEYMSAIKF